MRPEELGRKGKVGLSPRKGSRAGKDGASEKGGKKGARDSELEFLTRAKKRHKKLRKQAQ